MSLDANAKVPGELRRIINNGFSSHHPFKYGSAQLTDFIRIAGQIRLLPAEAFSMCFDAIAEILNTDRDCVGCYGKGLAYLKYLAKEVDEQRYAEYAKLYHDFFHARDWATDFEAELLQLIRSED